MGPIREKQQQRAGRGYFGFIRKDNIICLSGKYKQHYPDMLADRKQVLGDGRGKKESKEVLSLSKVQDYTSVKFYILLVYMDDIMLVEKP